MCTLILSGSNNKCYHWPLNDKLYNLPITWTVLWLQTSLKLKVHWLNTETLALLPALFLSTSWLSVIPFRLPRVLQKMEVFEKIPRRLAVSQDKKCLGWKLLKSQVAVGSEGMLIGLEYSRNLPQSWWQEGNRGSIPPENKVSPRAVHASLGSSALINIKKLF